MASREVYDGNGNLIGTETIPDPPTRYLQPIEIVELFTPSELFSIEQATDLRAMAFRSSLFAAVNSVALDDARFTGAVALFVALGILSAERSQSVLSGVKP